MTNREELEAALAKAEATREYLEAALAKAKVALVTTVTNATKLDANRAEASTKVDKARANCVRARAALREFIDSNRIATSHERGYIQVGEGVDVPNSGVISSPPSTQSRAQAVRSEEIRSQDESRRRKAIARFKNTLARSPRVREASGLLVLEVAYLQYYYFDVQLQILSLPSVVVLLLH